MENYINKLNDRDKLVRLESLATINKLINTGEIATPQHFDDVNNHIHSTYSFSPYSPTSALFHAYDAGLRTAGIMDHDSISGAREFLEAAKIIGMDVTIGMECRADMSKTKLAGKRINNPDQNSIAYLALHGVPHTQIEKLTAFFAPRIEYRNKRNRKMIENINNIMSPHGITLDFEKDVIPLSYYYDGGSITERHLLFALSKKIGEKFGKGQATHDFLVNSLKISLSSKIGEFLCDFDNPYYEYDLVGALKSDMVPMIYVDATDECPNVQEIVSLAKETGAILAYAYLGDVGNSVTGDKKTQKFEDDYLDLLFETLNDLGIRAVTYMPSRNTMEQIKRLKSYCEKYDMFQVSGEDINTPRQSFICMQQRDAEFSNLKDATWALIGHEKAATKDLDDGFLSVKTITKYPTLLGRIPVYKKIGLEE